MKNLYLLSAIATISALAAFNACAETSVQATGVAKIKIVDAVAMEHDTSAALDFGTAMAAVGHTITIDPATGNQTSSDTGQIVEEGDRDHFVVTAPAAMDIGISLPASLQITDKLNVTSFTSSPATTMQAVAGDNDLYVGGTLAVTAGATASDTAYTENYTVTISY